ncbi:plasmid partitioning protein RepB [Acidisoma silvae]|uniref:Plasmid partitioning protein RepB n=1 Tax=Acidisoma silvae TaxID=2802396 RepID=A0A963YXG3_9PROT|nr:plasmid partitioning protein RepB [Acidisoma silvae]MCB8878105.1 plasmid partitioning protein RepB [Acidisoma silvae]
MARKNLLTGLTEKKLSEGEGIAASETGTIVPAAPVRAPSSAFSSRGAFGAVTRTIDDLAARADAARTLEATLATGETIVELDPAAIDRSPVADRMEPQDESYRALRDSIAEKGQDSPILVRPHPVQKGRYQVAFGHRRLAAATELGRPVRAIVKALSDRDLVIAQGQENSARADLSFIERSRFAQSLEVAGHDRETIMQALSIDKTTLSRLISVASRLPTDIVEAVGPAPAAGRDRWVALSKAYMEKVRERPVDPLLESHRFLSATSDRRFEMLFQHLTRAVSVMPRSKPRSWVARNGQRVAIVTENSQVFTLAIDRAVAPEFGSFLLERIEALYEEYQSGPRTKSDFHISLDR